jgi:hypothetical protein
VTGRSKAGRKARYGCPQNFCRGACENKLKERVDIIEDCLLSQLQNAVLTPQVIDHASREFQRQLAVSLSNLGSSIGRARFREKELQQELHKLVDSVAQCGHSTALGEAINVRERELRDLTRQLWDTDSDSVSGRIAQIREFVTGQLGSIRGLLQADAPRAKAELAKHVGTIRMIPHTLGKHGYYVAEGEWDLLGEKKRETSSADRSET